MCRKGWLILASAPMAAAVIGGTALRSQPDPLAARGYHVSAGAAPGYLEDQVCATCHEAIAVSYREVGMARAFARPRQERDVEDFQSARLLHAKSGQRFELRREGDRLLFKRYELDDEGEPINVFEQEVDWILGSGNHARIYLYRTPGGDLYQLPVAWYAGTRSWGMAPGFDGKDHDGVLRRVRRECIFCHDAYPEVAAGSDARHAPHVFPDRLPEGIGCQRCHGPGARHVRAALLGGPAQARAAIVNPARLPARLRDAVCDSCHLQPAVALAGPRRFGRGDYSFRPGEALEDYVLQVDVEEEGRPRGERFEINHHPYRLRQSRCFSRSEGGLSCLTCHDPHRKVPSDERAAHYRSACLLCHRPGACGRPGASESTDAGADCVSCHMPKRRTQDVVQAVMTDHLIQRRPGGPELLAPLAETEPVLLEARIAGPEGAVSPADAELYRALAVLRATGSTPALDRLETLLRRRPQGHDTPYLDMALAQLEHRRFASAERTAALVLERTPGQALAAEYRALAWAGLGRRDQAIPGLRQALQGGAARVEARVNLGQLLLESRRPDEALEPLEQALASRPNLVTARLHLGDALVALNRTEEAVAHYRRILEIDPSHTGAYLRLGRALLRLGRRVEALRYWRHGLRAAAQPDPIARALDVELAKAAPP